MVLGSSLSGNSAAANGSISSQQGSKLSQMKDSFRKQMQRDKEKAKVPPTSATRTSPAAPRAANGGITPRTPTYGTTPRTTNGGTTPRTANGGITPTTRPTYPAPKTTKAPAEEERRPLRQTQTPAAVTSLRTRPSPDPDAAPKKSPTTSPFKTPLASSPAARPRSTPATPNPPATRAPAAMKKAPPPSAAASDLPGCRHCGRHFAQDRLTKHEEICLRTSRKKRKVFDPTKMRVKGTEAEAYVRNPPKASKLPPTQKSDWRRKHEDFIRSIRDAKAAQAYVAAGGKLSDLPPPPPMDTSHLIPCPHCGRKFNDAAAERHIPRCKDIMSHKPKVSPSAKPGTSGAIPKGRSPRR